MTPPLAVVLGDDLTMTVGVVGIVVAAALGLAQNTWHISGLRESRAKMEEENASLRRELDAVKADLANVKATASIQGQQIAHIVEMLTEMRADVKRLLQQSHP